MPRKARPKPTDSELAILRVLWQRGPSTVREVRDALARTSPASADSTAGSSPGAGYTTVLKLLQIMTEKGSVVRDESQRAHVYTASEPEAQVQQSLVGDLLDRAFGGSAAQLVQRALASRPTSGKDLAEIRRLLDELEGDDRPEGEK